jgi:hypothetical protein
MNGIQDCQKSEFAQNVSLLTGIEKRKAYIKAWKKKNQDKVKEYDKKRYAKNPNKVKERSKVWKANNPDKLKQYERSRYANNTEKEKERAKKWKANNQDKVKEKARAWKANNLEKLKKYKESRKNNKEKENEKQRIWAFNNPEKVKEKQKRYRENNKEKLREKKKMVRSTPRGLLNSSISRVMRHSLKHGKNGCHWETLVDFTVEQLKKHLEKKFTKGMSWDLFLKGEIHIDHKIPISAFNFETPDDIDFKKCWSLKNLQPMWAKENLTKNAKLEKPFQPSLTL